MGCGCKSKGKGCNNKMTSLFNKLTTLINTESNDVKKSQHASLRSQVRSSISSGTCMSTTDTQAIQSYIQAVYAERN